MADLEAATQLVLGPMIDGQPVLLTDHRGEHLATWAVKTALMMTATWDRRLPPDPFHDLYATRRPSESTTVWCGSRDEHRVAIHHRPLLQVGLLPGGGAGNRTPGLNSAIVALYQLSYTPAGDGPG